MNSYILITIMCFVLFVSVALSGAAETVQAATYGEKCGEDVYWNYDTETEVFKVSGKGTMTSASWKDADNNQYGDISFYDYELKVVIEKGVTSVVDDAFYFLDVKEVIFGPDVVAIGESAFSATNLKKVSFSDSIKKLGKCAFRSTYIKSADLKNIEEVGERAFEECGYLEKVVFGENLRKISKEAFADCLNLKEIFKRKYPNSNPGQRPVLVSGRKESYKCGTGKDGKEQRLSLPGQVRRPAGKVPGKTAEKIPLYGR